MNEHLAKINTILERTTDFMGRDGTYLVWFAGVVEDRQKNSKQCKNKLDLHVRVRCLGYHTEDKECSNNYRLIV